MICTNYQQTRNNSYLGKFPCPLPGMPADKIYCCGDVNNQYCCSHMETLGAKWGLAVGIIIGLLILAVLAYTIHAIRALDRCYHECPACGRDDTFKLDCRWYTVSNEGNRYGVTFHSRKFAKSFMMQLATRYGQWNQADILRIKKNGKDFVVLNIYFNDMFTPWFYTQGPMKNDTEWINSDFVELVTIVKEEVRVPLCCSRRRRSQAEIERKVKAKLMLDSRVHVRIDEPDRRCSPNKKHKYSAVRTNNSSSKQHCKTLDRTNAPRSVKNLQPGSREYLQVRTSQWHRDSDDDINVPSVIIEDVEPSTEPPLHVAAKASRSSFSANNFRGAKVSELEAMQITEPNRLTDGKRRKSSPNETTHVKPLSAVRATKTEATNYALDCNSPKYNRNTSPKSSKNAPATATSVEVHSTNTRRAEIKQKNLNELADSTTARTQDVQTNRKERDAQMCNAQSRAEDSLITNNDSSYNQSQNSSLFSRTSSVTSGREDIV